MANMTLFLLPIILILLLMSAFFSASETSLLVLNRIRLRHMITKGVRNSKLIHKLISDLDSLIATILVGNNFVNTSISVLITILFIDLFGNTFLVALAATLLTAALLVYFGEMIPKILALRNPERVSIEISPPMRFVVIILRPITRLFTGSGNYIMNLFGLKSKKHLPLITEEEVRLMIEAGKEEGLFGEEQRKMLHRIFEFGSTSVKDVMISKEDIVGIDISSGQEELLNVMAENGHSRLVVYKNKSKDEITGIIYVRDALHLLRNGQLIKIPDLINAPYIVSPDKMVNDLLKDFQKMHIHLAVVADAQGKTLGLVTSQDLLEEIVGEI